MAPVSFFGLAGHEHTILRRSLAASDLLLSWIYLNIIVNTILPLILVVTFLISTRVKRHPTLVNLFITWIFSGQFAVILFYVKEHVGPEPDKAVCIAQASLLFGTIPMWSVAILVMLSYMVQSLKGEAKQESTAKLVLMLVSPYAAWFVFTLAAFFLATERPDKVTRARTTFYCSLDFPPLNNGRRAIVFFICLGIVAIEIQLALIVYRTWRGLRSAGRWKMADFQLVFRVLGFAIYVTAGIVINLVSTVYPGSVFPDMYSATAGIVLFLLFGTQPDVLRVWFFWLPTLSKRRKPILVQSTLFINPSSPLDLLKSARPEKVAEAFADLPPLPPPKSKEYLANMSNMNNMRPTVFIDISRPAPTHVKLEPARYGHERA
ncbi:hypothetical protein NLJ89_g8467 [Agrocybe chaxingu]|uniref:Uncharacterized protein n=1 Tax=Agrocybe chaxingu TaxID=84603 RepID=A0A9W8MSQ6_9AGAR|nr:hypothetical protein NLJ89_g8467 [Agrocybe chaxingu]